MGAVAPALRSPLGPQQGLIDLLHPGHALFYGRKHLFFQEAELLFSMGMLDPGAAQRPAGIRPEDPLDGFFGGLEQQERIFLGRAEG